MLLKLYTHAPEVFSVGGQWYLTHTGDATGGPVYGGWPDYRAPGVQVANLRRVPEE
jgi:hypothetical protein